MLVKRRLRTTLSAIMVLAIALATLLSSPSFADDTTSTDSSSNVLRISPLRTDVQISAGSSKTVQVTISNLTSNDLSISAIENDFVAGNEDGTPSLILDANKYAPTHSLKRFMTPIQDVTIPAKQAKTIDVLITVPSGAQAGGYFGAVRFTPTSTTTGGQVNLNADVASLILLTVPGPTVEKLNLTDFDIQQSGKTSTYFQTPTSLQAFLRFENKGNLQEAPFGNIAVKQGSKLVYETSFNTDLPHDEVLPDSARRWEIPLKDIGNFGYFTVTATLAYGQTGQIEVTKSFWVIPPLYIIGAIVALVLLIAVIILIIFLARRRRRHSPRYRGMGRRR